MPWTAQIEPEVFPSASGHLSVTLGADSAVGYHRQTRSILRLNREAYEVLARCDGTRSVFTVINEICDVFPHAASQVAAGVQGTLAKFEGDGLIKFLRGPAIGYSLRVRDSRCGSVLQTLMIETTTQCNLACPHCYNESNSHSTERVEHARLLELLDQADQLGVITVVLTGGEPFFRQDILDIAEYISAKGMELALYTNATRILTPERILRLSRLNPRYVAVSVDSVDPDIYAKIRGAPLSETIANIDKLRSFGIPVRVNSTIFPGVNSRLDQIRDFLNFFKARGFVSSQIAIDEVVPVGRAAPTTVRQAVARRAAMGNLRAAWLEVFNASPPDAPDYGVAEDADYCGIGTSLAYITAGSQLALCPLLREREFIVGDLGNGSLRELWSGSSIYEQFRRPHKTRGTSCQGCAFTSACGGGCRAKAVWFGGNLLKSDEWQCAYHGKPAALQGDAPRSSPLLYIRPKAS